MTEVKQTASMRVIADFRRCLYGEVFGHPKFEDGSKAYTSAIVERNGDKVETRNTVYTLLPSPIKPAIDKAKLCADIEYAVNEVLVEHYGLSWSEIPEAKGLAREINTHLAEWVD